MVAANKLREVFGQNLASLLADAGVSVTRFAKETGVPRVQIHRMLNHESFPRVDALQKICEYFDVDARILLEEKESYRRIRDYERHGREVLDLISWTSKHPTAAAEKFPTGFFQYWRKSRMEPHRYFSNLILFYHGTRSTIGKIGEIGRYSIEKTRIGFPAIHSKRNYFITRRQIEGWALLNSNRTVSELIFLQGFPNPIVQGFSENYALSCPKRANFKRSGGIVLIAVGADRRAIRAAARSCGTLERSQVPNSVVDEIDVLESVD